MMTLPEFQSVDSCPACGLTRKHYTCPECYYHWHGKDWSIEYIQEEKEQTIRAGVMTLVHEGLKRTCSRCGYYWSEKPLFVDSKDGVLLAELEVGE